MHTKNAPNGEMKLREVLRQAALGEKEPDTAAVEITGMLTGGSHRITDIPLIETARNYVNYPHRREQIHAQFVPTNG